MFKQEKEPNYKNYTVDQFEQYWSDNSIRQRFIDNSIPEGCKICFDDQMITTGVRSFTNNSLIKNTPNITVSDSPEHIEIKFGNYCNLKCIMCGPYASSQLETEYRTHKDKFDAIEIYQPLLKQYYWWEDPDTLKKVQQMVKTAKYISFSGGEPLLINGIYDILDHAPRDCVITISTNLTRLTNKHIEYFQKFKNIRIRISLDGIGTQEEYLRYGTDWDKLNANIQQLISIEEIDVGFTYLLQHTSVYTYPELWNYVKSTDKSLIVSTVYGGSISEGLLTINSAPEKDVESFKNWIKLNSTPHNNMIKNWIESYKFNPILLEKFKKYVTVLDQVRGTNYQATFNPNW
jgi:hypothetical protein